MADLFFQVLMASEPALKMPPQAKSLTPMMRQYFEIKTQHEDAILMYRLGDFYEMFYDDAKVASQLLDLTLTTRNKNSPEPVPLCGVPYHAVEGYIAKLVSRGQKVVICDQVEDPKLAKGIVKREVTRVVSPGIVLEDQCLSARTNNYLMCVVAGSLLSSTDTNEISAHKNADRGYCYAVCDVSTGQFEYATLATTEQLVDEIARLEIREFVFCEKDRNSDNIKKVLQHYPELYHRTLSDLYADCDYATDLLKEQYHVSALESLGLEPESGFLPVLGLLLGYLKENKILTNDLLQQPKERVVTDAMLLDESTVRNMELFKTLRDEHHNGSLIWHLDHCQTAMGSRLLTEWLRKPLITKSAIEARLSAVEEFVTQPALCEALRSALASVADLERITNRFVIKTANARDAMALSESFEQLPQVQQHLAVVQSFLLQGLRDEIFDFSTLSQEITRTLVDEPPLQIREGHIIRSGVSAELDELRQIEKSGKNTIAAMEGKEKERTGISSLKIRYNNVFGYYIEITHTHKDKVPANYIRKQTLSHAERFITEELKQYEQKVLGASERIKAIEHELFCELREKIHHASVSIKKTSAALAALDVLLSLAVLARKFRYTKPVITTDSVLDLKEARHPIIERLNMGEAYIPNDVYLDATQNSVVIITGPNMAGKSTVMRMTGLIVIMAQLGSFVPCDEAHIGLCDRVFTRVGAHDYLQKGMSTFMVEMVETARILREATSRSLILLDEIGRGTSTFDGLSIAWAVAEDIHDRIHARTLFATHYHELCDLAEQKKGIKNYQMTVREWNQEIIFLRKLKSGGSNRSYGVVVASMAGLSPQTVKRAKEILKLLEVKDLSFQSDLERDTTGQMGLFENTEHPLMKKIRALDVDHMTPLDALNFLCEIKEQL